jgi:hypothetical protein
MILCKGVLPSVKWSGVKKDFQLSLSQFFHRQLKVSFVLVPTVGESIYVNVDTKMLQESSDAVIVHGGKQFQTEFYRYTQNIRPL